MSGEFAGRLRARVTLERPNPARDPLGSAGGWLDLGIVWAAVERDGSGAADTGGVRTGLTRWRLTLRPCDVAVGDRIGCAATVMIVREVRRDPTLPDRVVAIGEEQR